MNKVDAESFYTSIWIKMTEFLPDKEEFTKSELDKAYHQALGWKYGFNIGKDNTTEWSK